jgi:glycosyltransferase involved in cell wall biosynthesis
VAAYGGRSIIALAERFRDGLVALGLDARDIAVIGPAYDGTHFAETAPPTRASIIYLGRVDRDKGIFELLDGFLEVADRAELLVVGSGTATDEVRLWVERHGLEGRVRLTGRLEGIDKVRMLQTASIFALPSHSEGVPVSMLEAMAAGLPVVVTDVGGISEIVEDGRNGWVIGEPADVGVALSEAVSDPRLCREMGAANRKIARRFEAAVIARQIETAYLRELQA